MTASHSPDQNQNRPVVLVTGAAKRIGAVIARHLHAHGYDVAIHCRHSESEANLLAAELNQSGTGHCAVFTADLDEPNAPKPLIEQVIKQYGRLDALVNNASTYYATPLADATLHDWDRLFASNARAPFFLAQAAMPHLVRSHGVIVNIIDIYAERPLPNHPIYCMAKAALSMATKSLALELGPEVRVNGIAPGNIMWSENPIKAETADMVHRRTTLKRQGKPQNIAETVRWLIQDNNYITGHILPVDGGRLLHI